MYIEENQTFNLSDTNGRRDDIINALQGYLSILDNLNMEWGSLPRSLAQYEFYKSAIALSPDVFQIHEPYDNLLSELNNNSEFKNALINKDIAWIQTNKEQYRNLIKKFDCGIEDRARHYTSTLVKLGFTNDKRKISNVGNFLLEKEKLIRDEIEKILPLDNTNIIYLRQLLKLRIYNQEQHFYAPFIFAIYVLLRKNRLTEKAFLELVQGLTPYDNFSDIDNFIDNYSECDILNLNIEIPEYINSNSQLDENIFKDTYTNRKSQETKEVYWKYYIYLFEFYVSRNAITLNNLLAFYESNKSKLNSAFGLGKNIFSYRRGERPSIEDFVNTYNEMFENNLNTYLYKQFILSKKFGDFKEYTDTTKRIFRGTGIISFDNGYVELAYKELLEKIFNRDKIKTFIYGLDENSKEYEDDIGSYFCSMQTLTEILCYSASEKREIIELIKEEFSVSNIEQISERINENRKREFAEFISEKYPLEKVKELLGLFSNRCNDSQLKEYVSSDATVPTIYEFVVGIAWYYFAGKRIDLLNGYNLTLSANFEPLVHAGGGQGDIVIYEDDKVVMLEATLMNSSSQKRGEWEPVLRHSVNLKVEEEINGTQRQVTTFFIADEFDANTINIWKAVAAVPMQSSVDRESYTDNVVIMPINSSELSALTDKSDEYDQIIDDVHSLFEVEKNNFDLNWRDNFIRKIV